MSNDESSFVRATIKSVINDIEGNSWARHLCMDIALDSGDTLFDNGEPSIRELVELLQDKDNKTQVLAMIYLGTLHQAGLDASIAINPIKQLVILPNPEIIKNIGAVALAMLGDPIGIKLRDSFMKKHPKIASERDYYSSWFATVVEYVAGTLR